MSKGVYKKRGKEGTERAGVGAARVPPVNSICVCGRFDETPLQLVGFDEFALIYWFYGVHKSNCKNLMQQIAGRL